MEVLQHHIRCRLSGSSFAIFALPLNVDHLLPEFVKPLENFAKAALADTDIIVFSETLKACVLMPIVRLHGMD